MDRLDIAAAAAAIKDYG